MLWFKRHKVVEELKHEVAVTRLEEEIAAIRAKRASRAPTFEFVNPRGPWVKP